jgi:hypothetical protein
MGQKYGQLCLEERCEIARLHAAGGSRRAIAEALGRNPATISRELKRNTDRDVGYKPARAQRKADERCWKGARLERDDILREEVLAALKRGWSPEQVAGWLGARAGQGVIARRSGCGIGVSRSTTFSGVWRWKRWRIFLEAWSGFRGIAGPMVGPTVSALRADPPPPRFAREGKSGRRTTTGPFPPLVRRAGKVDAGGAGRRRRLAAKQPDRAGSAQR